MSILASHAHERLYGVWSGLQSFYKTILGKNFIMHCEPTHKNKYSLWNSTYP